MAKAPDKVNRPYIPKREVFERDRDNSSFYNSWPWRKLAKRYKDSNPICVMCEANGLIVPVKVVDHIVPINAGGEELNESNLQSLCEQCHNKKSAGERGGNGVKSL